MATDGRVNACFYLDKRKLNKDVAPVVLARTDVPGMTTPLRLDGYGLLQGDQLLCPWSLNGGSGTKEKFVLDGNFAIPILNPACEAPFGHHLTGIGFGDWYLTLCGTASGHNLIVKNNGETYSVRLDSLEQWSRYEPGRFPITGDIED